jgi:hypothetical protein
VLRVAGQNRGFVTGPRDVGVDGPELDALIARQRMDAAPCRLVNGGRVAGGEHVMYFPHGKYFTKEAPMRDVAEDPGALEMLRVQRSRLADRMRPPWWYLTGVAIMYALVFGFPFASRFTGVSIWLFFVAALAVAAPLQWGWTRVTGIKMGFRNLSYPGPGRPGRYAVVVVSLAVIVIEHLLIERNLMAAAIAVAALGVLAEVVLQQVLLRGARQELRSGGGVA